jgi:hypothetical protein
MRTVPVNGTLGLLSERNRLGHAGGASVPMAERDYATRQLGKLYRRQGAKSRCDMRPSRFRLLENAGRSGASKMTRRYFVRGDLGSPHVLPTLALARGTAREPARESARRFTPRRRRKLTLPPCNQGTDSLMRLLAWKEPRLDADRESKPEAEAHTGTHSRPPHQFAGSQVPIHF